MRAAWETGNELGGYMLGGGAPPAAWTKDIASYIKKLAPNHLVADGTDGLTDYGGSLANTGMKVSNVDLVCVPLPHSCSPPLRRARTAHAVSSPLLVVQDRSLLPGTAVASRQGQELGEQLPEQGLLRRRE